MKKLFAVLIHENVFFSWRNVIIEVSFVREV